MAKDEKRAFEPQDLYLLKTVGDPQVSSDGRRVAYVVGWADREADEWRTAVYVARVDGREPATRFTHGNKDTSPCWSPDGRWLAFVSKRGESEEQVFVSPLDGGEALQVTKAKFGANQPAWAPDSKRLAYVARTGDFKELKDRTAVEKSAPLVVRDLYYKFDGAGYFDVRRRHIFVVDIETETETQRTDGDWGDTQPAWSPDGTRLAFVSDREPDRRQRPWRSDIWVVPAAGGRARKVTRSRGMAANPAFSPDGSLIAYVGHEHGDDNGRNTHLLIVPAAGGRAPHSVSAPLDRSVTNDVRPGRTFAWSGDGPSLLFLAGDRGTQALYRTGAANGSLTKLIGGERLIEFFAPAPDGKGAMIVASAPSSPVELWSAGFPSNVRRGSGQPGSGRGEGRRRERNLSHANDEYVEAVDLGRPGRIAYKGADGLEVEALVVYPPRYMRGRQYPVALQIHGGPHSAHLAGFLPGWQALVAAGYVVLLPNPRGSGTYGEAFAQACVGDWGGKDFEDLMAGVDELVRLGIGDAERLYVGGYSYGGFMTSWAVGHTDRFRAAAVGAPVTHLHSMFGTSDIPLFLRYEAEGTPVEAWERYREHSPVTYLENVRTPVLLYHQEGDLRCPIGQSEEIFQTLRYMGREVELVRYPGGSHGVATPGQLVDRMERILAWYDGHAAGGREQRGEATKEQPASKRGRVRAPA